MATNSFSSSPVGKPVHLLRRLTLGCIPALMLAFLSACVSEPSAVTGKKQSFGYSWEQELQLGAEADKEITAEMGLYENPGLQSYVEAIGQRVLQTSDFREASVQSTQGPASSP